MGKLETVTDFFFFLAPKSIQMVTAAMKLIKRHLFLGRKVMTNLDSILKSRDIPLSIVSFAIIFSHSEGCLFTLLIVSFAVQKLLSLIRSHFTFHFIFVTLGSGS